MGGNRRWLLRNGRSKISLVRQNDERTPESKRSKGNEGNKGNKGNQSDQAPTGALPQIPATSGPTRHPPESEATTVDLDPKDLHLEIPPTSGRYGNPLESLGALMAYMKKNEDKSHVDETSEEIRLQRAIRYSADEPNTSARGGQLEVQRAAILGHNKQRHLREFSSAVTMWDGDNQPQSIKMLYDTGSTWNMASMKLVKTHKLTLKKIREENLISLTTTMGSFVPKYQVEVTLKDPHMGVDKPTQVALYVANDLNGIGLIAGMDFISEHGIVLDPKKPYDSYVTISTAPSKEAKERRKKLLEEAKKNAGTANAILKTSTSSASASQQKTTFSQEYSEASSSQTSAPSVPRHKDSNRS